MLTLHSLSIKLCFLCQWNIPLPPSQGGFPSIGIQSAAIPLMKGARGMLTPKGYHKALSIKTESKANGTFPFKGG